MKQAFWIITGLLLAITAGWWLRGAAESARPRPPLSCGLETLQPASYEHGDRVAFAELIQQKTGHRILSFEPGNAAHQAILERISRSAGEALPALSRDDSPIKKLSRINEASRYFEDFFIESIDADPDFRCQIPATADGEQQRSGYPDLQITHLPSDTVAYLDPKLVAAGTEDSSFRSFYYQPRRETSKVHHDALHFVIGILHDGKDGDWTFTSWKLSDLSQLEVKLKSEFAASNRQLYAPEARIE